MNSIDVAGRVAIVTGAARGIGRAIAERFAASGGRVAIWDIDGAAADKAASEIAGTAALTADVTDPRSIAQALAAVEARLGPPDILVNNAGISGPNQPLDEYPAEEWRRVIEIDLVGVFHCCQAVVPPCGGAITGGSSTSPRSPARRVTPTPRPIPPPRPA